MPIPRHRLLVLSFLQLVMSEDVCRSKEFQEFLRDQANVSSFGGGSCRSFGGVAPCRVVAPPCARVHHGVPSPVPVTPYRHHHRGWCCRQQLHRRRCRLLPSGRCVCAGFAERAPKTVALRVLDTAAVRDPVSGGMRCPLDPCCAMGTAMRFVAPLTWREHRTSLIVNVTALPATAVCRAWGGFLPCVGVLRCARRCADVVTAPNTDAALPVLVCRSLSTCCFT